MIFRVPSLPAGGVVFGHYFHDEPWGFERLVLTSAESDGDAPAVIDQIPTAPPTALPPDSVGDAWLESLVVAGFDFLHGTNGKRLADFAEPGVPVDDIARAFCAAHPDVAHMFSDIGGWMFTPAGRVRICIRNRGASAARFGLRLVRADVSATLAMSTARYPVALCDLGSVLP